MSLPSKKVGSGESRSCTVRLVSVGEPSGAEGDVEAVDRRKQRQPSMHAHVDHAGRPVILASSDRRDGERLGDRHREASRVLDRPLEAVGSGVESATRVDGELRVGRVLDGVEADVELRSARSAVPIAP